jgi:hypothetical protein
MVLAAVLGMLAAPRAQAFTFVLNNGSTDQLLTWRWQLSPNFQCSPCGNTSSANGRIPLEMSLQGKVGGMLDWTASSGRLVVVAMPIAWGSVSSSTSWSDVWSSVDARTPPTFMLIPEAGEPIPFSADLLIRVRIVGNFEQFPGGGAQAERVIHFSQAVIYNGVTVTSDALDEDVILTNGQGFSGPLSFPKGTANNVVLHGVPNNSIFTIPIWAYQRAEVFGIGSIDAYSVYGNGLAVEIEISNANAVGVGDEPVTPTLSLAARPNPASGRTRISYELPRAGNLRLAVYEVSGRKVATPIDRWEEAGRGEVSWNGRSDSGETLPTGVYFLELVAVGERRMQKLVWLEGRGR